MSEMIERVARAIAECHSGRDWRGMSEHGKDWWRDEARAAIEAMRLTDANWPDDIRYSDDIEAFNDTIDMAVGKASFPSGDRRAKA